MEPEEKSLAPLPDSSVITLDPRAPAALESWEDHISYYIRLKEISSFSSWGKADTLLSLLKKFPGDQSLGAFAQSVGEALGTVKNYVRIARAFPPEKRIPTLTFTHHFIAASVDRYDNRQDEFQTSRRFALLERAAEENMSTRRVNECVQLEKREADVSGTTPPCVFCHSREPEVLPYFFYTPSLDKHAPIVDLHYDCFLDIQGLIQEGRGRIYNYSGSRPQAN